jgi:hypothetical protein
LADIEALYRLFDLREERARLWLVLRNGASKRTVVETATCTGRLPN